jgi:hypothetical protein
LTNYNRYNVDEKFVFVANGSKVPVIGIGKCGILRQVYYVPSLSHSLLTVTSLTREGMRVVFKDDYAIISKGDSDLEFDTLRAKKINKLYTISQLQFELCTRLPHVDCLAHPPFGEDEKIDCFLADDIRTDPISNIHYMFGHPSAERTRYICKCYQLKDIRKLEHKAFEFLRNCTFCRQAKGKRNSFTGSVNRPDLLGKQWYADIKGPFTMPSLIHSNIYVFGIIEAKCRFLIQFYIRKKSDVEQCLRGWYDNYIQALRLSSRDNNFTHIFLYTDMGSNSHFLK